MLIKYVRDNEDNPVGCIVSMGREDLSWSLCSPLDKFDKKKAKQIALSRFKHFKDVEGWENPLNFKYWQSYFTSRRGYLGDNPNPYTIKLLRELKEQEERSKKYYQ